MSDGEKQVFSILIDILILTQNNSLLLIDEPELNLHPMLACKLWDTIENELSDCQFIYATHNISFAMRSNVGKILVLSNEHKKLTEIKNIHDIDQDNLRQFLGAVPSIISSNKALLIEGGSSSIDLGLYQWLLKENDIEIVPLGSCNDVRLAVNKTGVWNRLAPSVKLNAIIDRDYRSDDEIKKLQENNCQVIGLHEIESYLCIPEIVFEIGNRLGLIEEPTKLEDIKATISSYFKEVLIKVVCGRVQNQIPTITFDVSIKRPEKQAIDSVERLQTILSSKIDRHINLITEKSDNLDLK